MPSRRDAWTDWYDAHAAPLRLLARQWTNNAPDADDALQEAFVHFWRTRHTVADPAAYLFACVRRAAIDIARSAARRRTREHAVAKPERDPLFEPAASAERDDRRRHIESAMRDLPVEQREVLIMKLWGSLTFDAIGEAVGVSPNTAASRYRYAIAALRQTLEPEAVR